ncbi:hypothetical protein C8Q76DRAFT_691301 [Earliella scabrosa]|nr:hypothetical protein C8Q76DRAFT_691301 [Earliella scabrosa]
MPTTSVALDMGPPATIELSLMLTLVAACLQPCILAQAFGLIGNPTKSIGTRAHHFVIIFVLYGFSLLTVFWLVTPGSVMRLVTNVLTGSATTLPHVDGLISALWFSILCGSGVVISGLAAIVPFPGSNIEDARPTPERELELLMAQEELALVLDDARSQCEEEKAKTVAAEFARSAAQHRANCLDEQQQFVTVIAVLQTERRKDRAQALVTEAQVVELQNDLVTAQENFEEFKKGVVELGDHWERKYETFEEAILDLERQLKERASTADGLSRRIKVRDAEIDGLKWELSTKTKKGLAKRADVHGHLAVVRVDRYAVFPAAEEVDEGMLGTDETWECQSMAEAPKRVKVKPRVPLAPRPSSSSSRQSPPPVSTASTTESKIPRLSKPRWI